MPSRSTTLALIFALFLIGGEVHARDEVDPALARTIEGNAQRWYAAKHLVIEGRGWTETEGPYDRLPSRARSEVREQLWKLSGDSAGLCVRFVTDARAIHARWELTSSDLAMPHMPATGVSGLDLYVRVEGQWRWLGDGRPKSRTSTVKLVGGLPVGEREYLLYLPLYNGVARLEVGIAPDARLAQPPPRPVERRRPILFYGTSITQGGCASRPGMTHSAILGRWLDRPIVNLGFSGQGKMDVALAELMGELDAAVVVVDCLPNMRAKDVAERVEPFVRTLRTARPETPILLVEDRDYASAFLVASERARNVESRKALREGYERLIAAGVERLVYLEGESLIGSDGEGTVDGSHPTDLGFLRQARVFRPILERMLRAR